jgi:hypothetical protein
LSKPKIVVVTGSPPADLYLEYLRERPRVTERFWLGRERDCRKTSDLIVEFSARERRFITRVVVFTLHIEAYRRVHTLRASDN